MNECFSDVTHHGVVRHFNAQVPVAVSVLENHSDLKRTDGQKLAQQRRYRAVRLTG